MRFLENYKRIEYASKVIFNIAFMYLLRNYIDLGILL